MTYLTFSYQKTPKITQIDLFDQIYNNTLVLPKSNIDYPEYCTIQTEEVHNTPSITTQLRNLKELKQFFTPQVLEMLKEGLDNYYESYKIKKHSGGYRPIDAPKPELKSTLKRITNYLQNNCFIHPHNAAYAYVPKRCAKHSLQRHQYNQSKHFLHLDLENFFGSCDAAFIHQQLKQIFPFSELYKTKEDQKTIYQLVELALYKGRLPQGSPLSPFLTNIIMIPIDYALYELFRQYNKQHFVYTRYADDIDISSKYDFDYKEILKNIEQILAPTPLKINYKKVHYTTTAHRNWHLGLMLNQQNNITLGHKRKKEIKKELLNYCLHKDTWEREDIEQFHGELMYFAQIEPDYFSYIIQNYTEKYNENIDIITEMRQALA